MNFDTLVGKLALVGLTGVVFAVLYVLLIALFVDAALVSMDWFIASVVVGAGCSYPIYQQKGVIQ